MKHITHQARSEQQGIKDPIVERDIGKVIWTYLTHYALLDFMANFPPVIFYLIKGRPEGFLDDSDEYVSNTAFTMC